MSPLSRWKKVELLDLAEKLRLDRVANSVRKSELVAMIEEHLGVLSEPLDVEVDYPELKSFYDAVAEAVEQPVADLVESAGPLRSPSATATEESEPDGFSKLDFSEDRDGHDYTPFKFAFHEYLSDVVDRVQRFNESVQDSLSTIQSVDSIFAVIEFYYVMRPLVARQDGSLSAATLVTWIAGTVALPALVGYYINFIRYDLPPVQVDPMVFHVTKFLISLAILNVELSSAGNGWVVFVHLGVASWRQYLGQLPLVFALVGALLTVYIF